jgi:hypothetical protein
VVSVSATKANPPLVIWMAIRPPFGVVASGYAVCLLIRALMAARTSGSTGTGSCSL